MQSFLSSLMLLNGVVLIGFCLFDMYKYGTDNSITTVFFFIGLICFIIGGILK